MKKLTIFLATILVLASTFSILATPVVNTKNEKDIVETAIDNGQFTILTKALEAAGLTEILKKKGNFTVERLQSEYTRKFDKLKSLLDCLWD